MYSKSQLASKWIQYYLRASNSRGHGIHSPFVYEFIRQVLNDDRDYYAYTLIEKAKENLLQDQRMIKVEDMGAARVSGEVKTKRISDITNRAVSTRKFGRLLFRLANFYRARQILEMGSSVGISTAYLASADPTARVTTLEGSQDIANIASETFHKLKLKNISQVTGHFDIRLPEHLSTADSPDLIFMDGNHRKQPVLQYFNLLLSKVSSESVIIIHDIYWSREMEEAWEMIQNHPDVMMSIDIFSAGLVFFREEFKIKQHFTIRF